MSPIVDENDEKDENVPKLLCQMDNHLGIAHVLKRLCFHLLECYKQSIKLLKLSWLSFNALKNLESCVTILYNREKVLILMSTNRLYRAPNLILILLLLFFSVA